MIIIPVTPQDLRITASPTFAGLTLTGLTAGRVVYVGASDELTDSANLTFDGTTLSTVKGAFTQTIGTAPFTVVSTTKVTYLNADRLDDAHVGTSGAAIPLMSTANTWSQKQTINVGSGGTNYGTSLSAICVVSSVSGVAAGAFIKAEFYPASSSSASHIGLYIVSDVPATVSQNITGYQTGMYFDCFYRGSGTLTNQYGIVFAASNIGTGTVTNSYGIFSSTGRNSSGNIGTAISVRAALANVDASTGNITDGYFFQGFWNGTRVFLGTVYGLYLPDMTSKGATVWSLYCAGGPSSHAGNFRIGSNVAPTVALDVTGQSYILSTSEQLRLQYDASNYFGITVNSTGSVTLSLTGTTPLFNFSQGLVITGAVTISTTLGVTGLSTLTGGSLTGSSTNKTEVSNAGIITQAGTARINWSKKTAASITVTAGTATGTVSNLQTAFDGSFLAIAEAAAAPGIDVYAEFTSITAFNWVNILAQYNGTGTHAVAIQLYDWVNARWDTFDACQTGQEDVTTASGYILENHSFIVPSDTNYIGTGGDAGKVRVRFYHTMSGNASHDLYIDVVALYQ